MEKNSTFWKNSLKHGLMLGLVMVIYSVLLYIFELNLKTALVNIVYVFIIAGLFLGTKTYRNENLEGFISYGKALGYSMIILLAAVVIYTIYSYIFITIIDPEFVDKIMAVGEEKMLERGMSDDQVEMAQSMQKKFMSPGIMLAFAFAGYMVFGTILALITSAIVKKEGNSFDAAMQDTKEE